MTARATTDWRYLNTATTTSAPANTGNDAAIAQKVSEYKRQQANGRVSASPRSQPLFSRTVRSGSRSNSGADGLAPKATVQDKVPLQGGAPTAPPQDKARLPSANGHGTGNPLRPAIHTRIHGNMVGDRAAGASNLPQHQRFQNKHADDAPDDFLGLQLDFCRSLLSGKICCS